MVSPNTLSSSVFIGSVGCIGAAIAKLMNEIWLYRL